MQIRQCVRRALSAVDRYTLDTMNPRPIGRRRTVKNR
jgi:hypothetical protein